MGVSHPAKPIVCPYFEGPKGHEHKLYPSNFKLAVFPGKSCLLTFLGFYIDAIKVKGVAIFFQWI